MGADSFPEPSVLVNGGAVVRVLERLGILYALSGSMACSVHGIDRYTRAADFSVEPFPRREAEFAAAFRCARSSCESLMYRPA
jgi:hypothetical protein